MKHVSKAALITGAIELKDGDDDPNAVITKALDDLTKTVDERIKAVETKADAGTALKDRLDKIELRLNRPGGASERKDEPTDEQKGFAVYIRKGGKDMTADEIKTLRVSSDPQGGYIAPPEHSAEFIRDLVQFSPIRGIASVRQTGGPSVIYPARTGVTNAAWRGELQAQTASEPTFGEAEVIVRELNTYVDISNQLLADSAGAAEREVRLALAEDFGKKEGTAFVNGDGVLAPEGFMVDARVAYTANGHASNLSADALITLMYAVAAPYRNRGTWVLNSSTLAAIRKLKDGTTGSYLWSPGFQGQSETILGRPIVDAIDMPDATSDLYPIAFGDFDSAYRVVDRQEMSILANPYLLATTGVTRFHATRRLGGKVIRPAAIRKLKMATS